MATTTNSKERSAVGSGFPLNPEQRAAVDHGQGPLLVMAGAGTGKTRVITERIANLLASNPELAGENILALTFTDKAAAEMKHRVLKAAGNDRAKDVWLSTFHSFCLEKILREANPDIQPLDDIDHRILLRRNIAELDLKIFRRLADPAEFLRDFQTFFSRCQDELVTPDDYQQHVDKLRREYERQKSALEPDARAIAEEEIAKQEELARVYRVSERLLRERNLHTFGAQLLQAVELLRADADLLGRMREQYRYILVDEFQDTNIAQLELLWLLAGGHRNIVAVGDHDQAIYRFRGASFGSFTIFLRKFCGATDLHSGAKADSLAKDHFVSLSQNYRSTRRILRVAGEMIGNNERSPLLPPKNLTTNNPEGEKIRVVEFATFDEEAHWIASEIERLHAAGAHWKSFAVLYRKHAHRAQLVDALRRRRIPFVIRKASILGNTLVRDLLAWLRLTALPADNVACGRVLAAPYWALEPRDLLRLAERADKKRPRGALWDQVEAAKDEKPKLGELVETMQRLRQGARTKTTKELLDELIATLELAPSETDRQYVDRLAEFVKEWERKSDETRLRDFIEYLGYFNELDGDICIEEEIADDAVQLMSVHAAKGLEFPHVFILRLSRNDFPSGMRRAVFEFPVELMREELPKGDFQIQEERRLFYVAVTRAQQRLTLSTIVNKRKKASLFLEDFLRNPKIQKMDTVQSAPKVVVPPHDETVDELELAAPDPAPLFRSLRENSKAYSRIALWAKAFHPPRPEPLQLSASAIATYEHCPMRYLFRYSWGIPGGPQPQTQFGNMMHTTIKEFVGEVRKRGTAVPLEEMWAIFERVWTSAGFPDEYQEEEYRKAGREQLEAFYHSYIAAPPDVLYQEKPFELALEHDVVVTGRMDQVNRAGKGEVEIIDYKTGKARDSNRAAADLQLGIYALAAREVLDLEPSRLVFYNLVNNEAVATTRDEKALAATKQKITEVADLIRAGEFAAKPSFACGYCDYKPICPAHETLVTIRPMAP
jgi:DNA helicase II / ATP-dependent DNA helicase PcrA